MEFDVSENEKPFHVSHLNHFAQIVRNEQKKLTIKFAFYL
jgi:hypothetical protein